MASDTASRQPRPALWPALAGGLAGVALFQGFGNATRGYLDTASLFSWWGRQWLNPASETEHGLLIVPLAVWLLWRNLRGAGGQGQGGAAQGAGSRGQGAGGAENLWVGVGAMGAGLALHALGFAAQQTRVSIIALLVFTWGVLRLAGGRRWGRAAVFPLGFMVFAIPFDALDSVGFWLRLWVLQASTGLAHAVGIGVVQSGTQLLAPDGRYQYDVAAACSGVRSLVALLALALLSGYLTFRTGRRRAALFLLCLPLIYLGNVARITAIILLGQWGGQAWGERAHAVMGYGVFGIVLGGLLLASWLIERRWPEKPEEPGAGSREPGETDGGSGAGRAASAGRRAPSGWAGGALIVGLAVAEMFFLAHLAALPPRGRVGVRLAADGRNPVALPVFLGTEWIGRRAEVTAVERELLPPDTGYARMDYAAVADPARRVYLSVVLSGRDRTSIHRPELCLVGQGWTVGAATRQAFTAAGWPGGKFPATVLPVRRAASTPRGPVVVPQLVAYWFIGGDTAVASYWQRLGVDAWNRVTRARADRWAYVLLQTDARDGDAAALGRMQAVLDQALPGLLAPR